MKTRISIIIPIYNVEAYLTDCLKSVLSQDCSDIEIICVNDGSTDHSGAILKEYADKDSRIQVIEQANAGLSVARNAGLSIAKGKYILYVDSDDMLMPHALISIYEAMEQDDLDMLYFDAHLLNERADWSKDEFEDYKKLFEVKHPYDGVKKGAEIYVDMTHHHNFREPVWLYCCKRELLTKNHIQFEAGLLHEDGIYTLLCLLNAERVSYQNRENYVYRVRQGTLSTIKENKWRLDSLIRLYYLHLEQLKKYLNDSCIAETIRVNISILVREIHEEKYALLQKGEDILPDDVFMDSLYCGMRIGNYQAMDYDIRIYIKGFISLLECADSILLYGAGYYGKLLSLYLQSKGYYKKVIGFVVSHKRENSSEYLGKTVYDIHELPDDIIEAAPVVILSTDVSLHDVLRKNCKEAGLMNAYGLDSTLQMYIKGGELYD